PLPASTNDRKITTRYEAINLDRRLPNTSGDLLVHQLVAYAPDRLDPAGASGQLLAQPGHVNVDRSRVTQIVISPDEVEEALAVENQSLVLHKGQEEVKLLRAQGDRLVSDLHFPSGGINPQVAQGQGFRWLVDGATSTKHRLDPRDELARV